MKTVKATHYTVQVMRHGTMMDYSATQYPSLADAKVEARRLARKSEHYPDGNYVEIRQVNTTTTIAMLERFEAGA